MNFKEQRWKQSGQPGVYDDRLGMKCSQLESMNPTAPLPHHTPPPVSRPFHTTLCRAYPLSSAFPASLPSAETIDPTP